MLGEVRVSEEETDDAGRPLVLASDGTTTFGEITEEISAEVKRRTGIEFPAGRIVLSYGFSKGGHVGTGLMHIADEHGEQILSTADDIVAFIEDVVRNFESIHLGENIRGKQTFLLALKAKDGETARKRRYNVAYIELTRNGNDWVINTAFRSNGRVVEKEEGEIWSLSAQRGSSSADTSAQFVRDDKAGSEPRSGISEVSPSESKDSENNDSSEFGVRS